MGARRLALKAHPLTTIGGLLLGALGGATIFTVPVELEYSLAPNVSIFGLAAPLVAFSQLGVVPGIIAGGGARFFPFSSALQGFWFGGYGELGSAGGIIYDLQAQAGYAWVFDNGFYLGVGGSLSFIALAVLASGTPNAPLPIGLLVPIGFTF